MDTKMTIDGVEVSVSYAGEHDARITAEEARAYVERGREKFPHGRIEALELRVDGDEVEIGYRLAPMKFDRIRRITGYLVGTLDRFNDAKRSEEGDRVKHRVA